jgi:quercetin dioxygenase-like cupin family protein
MTSNDTHFSLEGGGEPAAPGRFVDVSKVEPIEMLPGLHFRPVLGERTLVNFVSFEPHSVAPMHTHEEEQVVVVLDGEFEFTIDGHTRTMREGDVAVIPSWVPHGAVTHDHSCREMDVFCPPRTTLTEHAATQVDASRIED